MTTYTEYMTKQIIEEIKTIQDPYILAIYLKAISVQRCHIGTITKDNCKECLYNNYNCRQLNEIANKELEEFNTLIDEEKTK